MNLTTIDMSEILHELSDLQTFRDFLSGFYPYHSYVTDGAESTADLALVLDDSGNPVVNDTGSETLSISQDEDDNYYNVWWRSDIATAHFYRLGA